MRFHVLWVALALVAVVACTVSTSSVGGNETCTPGGVCGTGTLQVCVTHDTNGVCTGVRYQAGGQSFQCNNCVDCSQAAQSAANACGGGTGSSGGSSGSGSGSSSGGDTTCTDGAACSDGSTMKVCTTLGANGACSSIAYTVGSQTFTCAGCQSCTSAQSQASQACAGSGSSSGGSSGSGSGSSSGGSSGSSSGGSSGSSSGGSSGSSSGSSSGASYDGTVGKPCSTDTDCHSATGPGTNKCSTDTFSGGPLYPTPVCISPTNCDPGTDGNLHFCDGPDDPSSPGVCLSTGTAGQGICLPQCTFKNDGSKAVGCQGKDVCYTAAFSTDSTGAVIGLGYCFGGCTTNTDCPSGSSCQTNLGLCLTTTTPPSQPGTGCNSTTTTGNACNCFSNTSTNLGFCANYCSVGGMACPSGWTCETDLPTSLTDANDASLAGWKTQTPGVAGICTPKCVVDGGAQFDGGVCPPNSTCQTGTVAGADCLP